MFTGGVPEGAHSIRDPIIRSGSATRSMGRFIKDSSPQRVDCPETPARIPMRSRSVVPEFWQSIPVELFRERFAPVSSSLPSVKMALTPSCLMALTEVRQSRAVEKLETEHLPLANNDNRAIR